jgi:hypothetical protein
LGVVADFRVAHDGLLSLFFIPVVLRGGYDLSSPSRVLEIVSSIVYTEFD